jgi:hypothetical protein
MQADGVLAPPPMGLVTAFSREQAAKVCRSMCLELWLAQMQCQSLTCCSSVRVCRLLPCNSRVHFML